MILVFLLRLKSPEVFLLIDIQISGGETLKNFPFAAFALFFKLFPFNGLRPNPFNSSKFFSFLFNGNISDAVFMRSM